MKLSELAARCVKGGRTSDAQYETGRGLEILTDDPAYGPDFEVTNENYIELMHLAMDRYLNSLVEQSEADTEWMKEVEGMKS